MATVKTKFRASSSDTKEGTLFYQVIVSVSAMTQNNVK